MLSFEDKFNIIKNKDKKYDDIFYYAVNSTGIFCFPSCASKKPKKENITFFDTESEALKKGYRHCKRCFRANEKEKFFKLLKKENSKLSVDELAKLINLSKYHFIKKFKMYTGTTPKQYFNNLTLNQIKSSLKSESVTKSLYKENLSSSSRFYEKSNELLGMTPRQYKKGGKNIMIYFALGNCYLGNFLVAQTTKGICALFLGNPEDTLKELQDTFPHATLVGDNTNFKYTIAQVIALLDNESSIPLDLDISGTLFQKRVWEILKNIPVGETRSYSQIADNMNMPKAARAVAKACASNKIAILIPCHRVIKNDGKISGYRWGIPLKGEILKKEKNSI